MAQTGDRASQRNRSGPPIHVCINARAEPVLRFDPPPGDGPFDSTRPQELMVDRDRRVMDLLGIESFLGELA
jgi:hypothetical protein